MGKLSPGPGWAVIPEPSTDADAEDDELDDSQKEEEVVVPMRIEKKAVNLPPHPRKRPRSLSQEDVDTSLPASSATQPSLRPHKHSAERSGPRLSEPGPSRQSKAHKTIDLRPVLHKKHRSLKLGKEDELDSKAGVKEGRRQRSSVGSPIGITTNKLPSRLSGSRGSSEVIIISSSDDDKPPTNVIAKGRQKPLQKRVPAPQVGKQTTRPAPRPIPRPSRLPARVPAGREVIEIHDSDSDVSPPSIKSSLLSGGSATSPQTHDASRKQLPKVSQTADKRLSTATAHKDNAMPSSFIDQLSRLGVDRDSAENSPTTDGTTTIASAISPLRHPSPKASSAAIDKPTQMTTVHTPKSPHFVPGGSQGRRTISPFRIPLPPSPRDQPTLMDVDQPLGMPRSPQHRLPKQEPKSPSKDGSLPSSFSRISAPRALPLPRTMIRSPLRSPSTERKPTLPILTTSSSSKQSVISVTPLNGKHALVPGPSNSTGNATAGKQDVSSQNEVSLIDLTEDDSDQQNAPELLSSKSSNNKSTSREKSQSPEKSQSRENTGSRGSRGSSPDSLFPSTIAAGAATSSAVASVAKTTDDDMVGAIASGSISVKKPFAITKPLPLPTPRSPHNEDTPDSDDEGVNTGQLQISAQSNEEVLTPESKHAQEMGEPSDESSSAESGLTSPDLLLPARLPFRTARKTGFSRPIKLSIPADPPTRSPSSSPTSSSESNVDSLSTGASRLLIRDAQPAAAEKPSEQQTSISTGILPAVTAVNEATQPIDSSSRSSPHTAVQDGKAVRTITDVPMQSAMSGNDDSDLEYLDTPLPEQGHGETDEMMDVEELLTTKIPDDSPVISPVMDHQQSPDHSDDNFEFRNVIDEGFSRSTSEGTDSTDADAIVTPDLSIPVSVKVYGGFQSLNWKLYRQDLDNFKPKAFLSRELPHALQDNINSWDPAARRHRSLRQVMVDTIRANTADDEPDAPPIDIINEVDDEVTPPWEFHYSNRMWHGEGVPLPDVTKLVSCNCMGKCDPKSRSCSCLARQQIYTTEEKTDTDFLYDSKGRLKYYDYPIFECNDLCGCGDECRNRVVQKGRTCAIRIQKTEEKGWGVFAGNKKIPQGTYIGIYAGELLTDAEGEIRGIAYNKFGRTYLFDLDFYYLKAGNSDWEVQYTVDAYHAGNFTRFLNHSCDPNCRLVPCYINESNIEKPLLSVFAWRDIEPFEEICFSYYGDADEEDKDLNSLPADMDAVYAKCACKSSNCTGYMFK